MKGQLHLLVFFLAGAAVSATNETALFEELTKSRDPENAIALARCGETAVPFLVQGLEKGGRTAALCAWALAQHPQPGAAKALRERLLKVDQVAGYYAARALGRLPSSENVAALAALLPNETNGFWELASGGIGRLRDAWDEKGRRYSAPVPTNMPNLRVAYAAVESLGELAGEQAATALLRALENDQYLIRFGAARGLGRMRFKAAEEKLVTLAEGDPVLIVRKAAEQALVCLRDGDSARGYNILGSSPIAFPLTPAPLPLN